MNEPLLAKSVYALELVTAAYEVKLQFAYVHWFTASKASQQ